jgi:trimeric autotransporter adhesin
MGLAVATSGEIWVAAGTYYPDEIGPSNTNNRDDNFLLKNNVTLLGGFPASGTPGRAQRNWKMNVTKLSGDIDKNKALSNNAYHVLLTYHASSTAVIDGFTITGGNADYYFPYYQGNKPPTEWGGGMMNEFSSPTIINCNFTGNAALQDGGGIFNNNSSPTIINCRFTGNTAVNGGAIFNYHRCSTTLINCSFWGNTASYGGSIYNVGIYEYTASIANSSLINCSFYGSQSPYGAAILNNQYGTATLSNCILWGTSQINNWDAYSSRADVSYSIVQGGYSGTGNKTTDPMFVDPVNGDFHLQFCSPAIEAGNNTVVANIASDADEAVRISHKKVDMGAYESQESRIFYVNPRATGLNTGRSWINAYTKLQDALNFGTTCQSPIDIWVARGTYYADETRLTNSNSRTASFNLKSGVGIYGGFAGTETQLGQRSWVNNTTILSGEIQQDDDYSNNSYHVVNSSSVDNTALLDGFTITKGNADAPGNNKGGGLYNLSSSPMLSHCSFEWNNAVEGGAIYNASGSPDLTNSLFMWNKANYGGAVYNYNNAPVFTSCIFGGNTATLDGGGVYNYGSSSSFTNCSFWGNKAAAGAGMNNFYSQNVRLINCSLGANTATDGGGLFNIMYSPTITNSIIWDNIPNQVRGDAIITWSIVQGGYNGVGNKAEDPQFLAAAGGLLELRGCSPAINSATATGAPNSDAWGKTRPALGGYDMGAYEYQEDGAPGIYFVNQSAAGPVHDGSSWTRAFTNIQEAIDQAATCHSASQVWVATGTYYPNATGINREASFILRNKVAVFGGFDGTETPGPDWTPARRMNKTELSGDIQMDGISTNNSYHVVQSISNDTTAILDGFIITGGSANGNGAYPENSDMGGGLLQENSFPTITNCIITNNYAVSFGGGVGNTISSLPTLANCLFYSNTARWGGAIGNTDYSNVTIINATVTGNTAEKGGAIYNLNTRPTVTNSILWNNTGGQIYTSPGTVPITYSIVQDGYYPGVTNKTEDPKFVSATNFHLQSTSPAIDSGNTAANILYTDLEGLPRKMGLQVDIGAYEFPKPPTPVTQLLFLRCPADYTVFSDPDQCGALADFSGTHAAWASSDEGPVTIIYAPASGTLLPVGNNLITVTATDSTGDTKTCSFTVAVIDVIPPVVTCPVTMNSGSITGQGVVKAINTEECTYLVQGAELDAEARDNCSAPLSYFFSLGGATISGGMLEASSLEGMELNPGNTTITWMVRDAADNESSCSFEVLVSDKTPPVISNVTANPSLLSPSNHKMRDINLSYVATDNCGAVATSVSVTNNESMYGTADGNIDPDWIIVDDHHLQLRAERSGRGSGRTYTITVTATDAAGNKASAATTVIVPHDKADLTTTHRNIAPGEEINSLRLQAFPNPSTDGFTISIQSYSMQPINIEVVDDLGRTIESRRGLPANGNVYLGSTYRPGIYVVQVTQANTIQNCKVVKQGR